MQGPRGSSAWCCRLPLHHPRSPSLINPSDLPPALHWGAIHASPSLIRASRRCMKLAPWMEPPYLSKYAASCSPRHFQSIAHGIFPATLSGQDHSSDRLLTKTSAKTQAQPSGRRPGRFKHRSPVMNAWPVFHRLIAISCCLSVASAGVVSGRRELVSASLGGRVSTENVRIGYWHPGARGVQAHAVYCAPGLNLALAEVSVKCRR